MKKTNFCEGWQFQTIGQERQPVLIPHDATQLSGRERSASSGGSGAYYLGGCYEYTKRFHVPATWKGLYTALLFEGVYPQAKVLLNGRQVAYCAYGYTQFEVLLNDLKYGEDNEITVIVDNSDTPNSRWYAGAGIYRPVWLVQGNSDHIQLNGLRVTTLSCDPAAIRVETASAGSGDIQIEIDDGNGVVARSEGKDVTLTIPDARLWSAEQPCLYTCKAMLQKDGVILDEAETTFGIRTLSWSRKGFFINGKETMLKGGCIHSDNGILGARSFDEAEWRRIRILKKWGFNAIRSAHNPLSRAALEACDALGMYVMDEAWDMWDKHKKSGDYAGRFPDHWQGDVQNMVAKDYNHPAVIMYSIGNEVTEPAKPEGVELARRIVREVKRWDTSRPVTAGINITLLLLASMNIDIDGADPSAGMDSTAFNEMAEASAQRMVQAAASEPADRISSPVLDLLDIAGYNYAQSRYEQEETLHPGRVVVGSETYPQDLPKNWKLLEKCPWVIGDFMWTAWDYLGEVGIGGWTFESEDRAFSKPYPWKLGDTGALDILGNDTAEAGMAAIVWGSRTAPYIAVRPMNNDDQPWTKATWRGSNGIPSWSWKGCEGRQTVVEVFTRAAEAELLLNGVSLGRRTVEDCKASFDVEYQPGELKAIAWNNDDTNTESMLCSSVGETHIHIQAEGTPEIGGVLFVDITLQGENGVVESHEDEMLTVTVKGGNLLAFGSAKPKTEEVFHSGSYTSYYGRCLAAVLVTEANVIIDVKGTRTPAAQAVLHAGNSRK